ncbi:multidrug transporter, partial [Francisella tularensis subsp. holarctica]|nr:multidrug transporter [Francisella tularensis subsp. holarctica]
ATMGGGGILSRNWGKSELVDKFQRNKETFLVHYWYFKRGFTIVIIIIAIIFYYNHSKHHDNSIDNFTLLFAIPFFMANI